MSLKKANNSFSLFDASQLKQILQTEEYDLASVNNGDLQKISLRNDHHITCKEYTITVDTATKKLVKVYYRLTNIHEPANVNKEKVIEIKVSVCDDIATIALYNSVTKVIDTRGKLRTRYQDYDLIHL